MAIDRDKLINKIKTIDGLTMQERNDLVAYLREQKVYGLVWEDKPEDVEQRLRSELPVLKEVKSRAIISDNPEAPNHILIEGDNLEALTTLAYTHEGRIDVIYIDPPYNTGNKDFVYNDSYIDREDGYRHSKWLSFMSKRLRIAKKLLSDRGVIFISIDDNEQAQLKLLCDEIFGEENGIGPIIQNKLNAKNDTLNIQKNHEFILCYRRKICFDRNNKVVANIIVSDEKIRPVAKYSDTEYFYLNDAITTRGEGGTLNARPNLGYTFYYNPLTNDLFAFDDYDHVSAKSSNSINDVYKTNELLIAQGYITIRPPKVRGKLGCWTWDINKANRDKKYLYVKKTANGYSIIKRTFISANHIQNIDGIDVYVERTTSNSKSIINFSTNDGTNIFNDIFGNEVHFNNPKNLDMLKYLLSISQSQFATILDFFAGSGTTLHATMQLNAEDGGKRQCILVTNNENGICENVTYERNRRVIQGYTTPKGAQVAGLTDNNLRYYRTTFVGRRRTPTNMRRLMLMASDMLCIKENIYTEHDEFGGMDTIQNGFRYFADDGRQMLVIYDETVIYKVVDTLIDMQVANPIIIYVFSPANDPWHSEFADVEDKVRLTALPAAIYNAYKRVLPKPDSDSQKEEAQTGKPESLGGLFDITQKGGKE